jgi:endo-1,4-beta-xylanase
VEFAPMALCDVYDKFAAFQRPLFVTEITIPQKEDTAEGGALQAELTANLYRLWFSAPRMAGITWWNLGDGTAVKGENKFRGGLADDNLEPKAAYRALDKLINGEWKTRASMQAGADGKACFRGFYGRYEVSVKSAQAEGRFEIDLAKPGTFPLVLK